VNLCQAVDRVNRQIRSRFNSFIFFLRTKVAATTTYPCGLRWAGWLRLVVVKGDDDVGESDDIGDDGGGGAGVG
jgi:hypothetical protein